MGVTRRREEEEKEEEGLFKADAVNEEDPERTLPRRREENNESQVRLHAWRMRIK